jgi:cobyrinic acid a,c-diamide synthase
MTSSAPRLVIAGLSGDSGKTIASLSFLTALKRNNHEISVFKKGPDYIDPAWLSAAARSVCRNLDTWLVKPEVVRRTFVSRASETGISVIEGNRGLFDGRDVRGTHSTAELAKLLAAPVVLVVDAAKTTRSVAAILQGCLSFDPDVHIAGVILNRTAGKRHVDILRKSIEAYTDLPVLGSIPKLGNDGALIPGRHLGLVTPSEHGFGPELRASLERIGEENLDVDGLVRIAERAGPISCPAPPEPPAASRNVRVGYFSDPVFTFYYPENLEALENQGAQLVPVSSLADKALPIVDAFYIGGGFPETHAEKLVRNRTMIVSVKEAAMDGLPVYAECGGLIYLSRSIRIGDGIYPMADLFPVDLEMHDKPVGHGYTSVEVVEPNPFYPVGTRIRGHEFHYSGPAAGSKSLSCCMAMESGVGIGSGRDGLLFANTLACYNHVHAHGTEDWASSLVKKAAEYSACRVSRHNDGGGSSRGLCCS